MLADGQRLPGQALAAKPQPDTLAWDHPWLGRVDVPLKLIESVIFAPNAAPPPPGTSDVILLGNGDKQEGFVTELGNPITLEVERGGQKQKIAIPVTLVAAITMVAPKQPVSPGTKRIWFDEGTVIDVRKAQ